MATFITFKVVLATYNNKTKGDIVRVYKVKLSKFIRDFIDGNVVISLIITNRALFM